MLKTFLQHNTVVLRKRGLENAVNTRRIRPFLNWQNRPPSKGYIQALQIPHIGSKTKKPKKHAKNASTRHGSCSMQKTAIIRDIRPF